MLNRRQLIGSTLAGSALLFVGHPAALGSTPTGVPRRRSLGEMDLDDPDLVAFRQFVRIMKDSSRQGNPVSWVGFAKAHGTLDGFNLCPHGNWYFLPWHRGYLRMYESSIREFTGHQGFALPYWDWTTDRQMPKAFAESKFDGKDNPLYVPGRNMTKTDSLPDTLVGDEEVIQGILKEPTFEAFASSRPTGQVDIDPKWIHRRGISSPLEATPHNNVHGIVGGIMRSGASPQDPIFLMHHCNIDRIWAAWNAKGRENTVDPLWLNMRFEDHFTAPDGKPYTDVVADLQEPAALGYTYGIERADTLPNDPARTLFISSLFNAPQIVERSGFPRYRTFLDTPASIQRPGNALLAADGRAVARVASVSVTSPEFRASLPEPQIYAILRDLEPSKPDTTQLRVFINCDYLSPSVPTTDPHYVATVGFFGTHAHDAEQAPSALVNLTSAIKLLSRGRELNTDEIRVQLLPTPQHGRSPEEVGTVKVGEVELMTV